MSFKDQRDAFDALLAGNKKEKNSSDQRFQDSLDKTVATAKKREKAAPRRVKENDDAAIAADKPAPQVTPASDPKIPDRDDGASGTKTPSLALVGEIPLASAPRPVTPAGPGSNDTDHSDNNAEEKDKEPGSSPSEEAGPMGEELGDGEGTTPSPTAEADPLLTADIESGDPGLRSAALRTLYERKKARRKRRAPTQDGATPAPTSTAGKGFKSAVIAQAVGPALARDVVPTHMVFTDANDYVQMLMKRDPHLGRRRVVVTTKKGAQVITDAIAAGTLGGHFYQWDVMEGIPRCFNAQSRVAAVHAQLTGCFGSQFSPSTILIVLDDYDPEGLVPTIEALMDAMFYPNARRTLLDILDA